MEAEGLAAADYNGKSDPFVVLEYGGLKKNTSTQSGTLTPKWGGSKGEAFSFPVAKGVKDIQAKVYDWDYIGKDLLGTVLLPAVGLPFYGEGRDEPVLDQWFDLQPSKESGLKGGPGRLRVKLSCGLEETRVQITEREATEYLYVTIIQGQNLIAADSNGFSDPYCSVNTNTCPAKKTTQVCKKTLNPYWGEANPLSFPKDKSLSSLRIKVYDDDVVGDDLLGEVDITIPVMTAGERVTQWHALLPSTKRRNKDLEKKAKEKTTGLGQIQVMLGCGFLKRPPLLLNERPSQRLSLGSLRIEVMQARNLKSMDFSLNQEGSSDCYCALHFEGRKEQTETQYKTVNPVFNEAFNFKVTEFCSQIRIVLWDEDYGMLPDSEIGMVCMPLEHLLKDKGQRTEYWMQVMRMPHAGSVIHRLASQPKQPIGYLKIACTLSLTEDLKTCYTSQRALPDPDEYTTTSLSRIMPEAFRLCDNIMSPLTGFLASMCYLQSWSHPLLNIYICVGLFVMMLFNGRITVLFIPCHIMCWCILQGYVTSRLNADLPVPLYLEDLDELKELKSKALDEAKKKKAKEEEFLKQANDTKENEKKKGGGNLLGGAASENPALKLYNQYQTMKGPMKSFQDTFTSFADLLEKVGNLLTWKDPTVTSLSLPLLVAATVVINLAWIVVYSSYCFLSKYNPFGLHTPVFVFWIFVILPIGHITQDIIATIDLKLMKLPVKLRVISQKSIFILNQRALKKSPEADETLKQAVQDQLMAREELEQAQKSQEEVARKLMNKDGLKAHQDKLRNEWFAYLLHMPLFLYQRSPTNRFYEHRKKCVLTIQDSEPVKNGTRGSKATTTNENAKSKLPFFGSN